MGERRVEDSEEGARATRRSELAAAAAAKREELRATAAAKREELGATAAAKREELAVRGGELRASAAAKRAEVRRTVRQLDVPWARCAPARMTRETILQFGLAPLMDLYTRMRVTGRESFAQVPPPVLLVANHSSHLDTPTILRALPLKWRQRTAVGAAADYFYNKRIVANAVALVFNTVPILRRGGGAGAGAFDHVDRLIDQRWNLLIFPEGTRSRDGSIGRLRSGAAVIAQEHAIPIVPVRVKGTHAAMPPGRNWPKRVRGFFSRRHRVEVHFGPPVWPVEGEERHELMERVRVHLDPPAARAPVARIAPRSDPRPRTGDARRLSGGNQQLISTLPPE